MNLYVYVHLICEPTGPSYLAAQINAQLEDAVRRAVTTGGGIGMHLLGKKCVLFLVSHNWRTMVCST